MNPVVLIPAYQPDQRLPALLKGLAALGGPPVLVVNDGSGPSYDRLFQSIREDYGCQVLTHTSNLGKGAAIKTGVSHLLSACPEVPGCVTADADLQHSPRDILGVAQALAQHPGHIILGQRSFSGPDIPFKSRWGNRVTAAVFQAGTGVPCRDTQTGLRGIPATLFPTLLAIPGNRFDFEMNFLLEAARMKFPLHPVPIQTIYQSKHHHTSHFRAVSDSLRIYGGILRYSASSIVSALLDLALFRLLAALLADAVGAVLAATILARCVSGVCNFLLNRRWVFGGGGSTSTQAAKYLALFFCQMLLSGGLVSLLAATAMPLLLGKILVDGTLFFISYAIQKRCVFPAAESVSHK